MAAKETVVVGRSGFPTNPATVASEPRYLLGEALAATPGRLEDSTNADVRSGEKPEDGSTPWRSNFYVTAGHSADGNYYAEGDTFPEVEAIRQGVYVPEAGTEATPEDNRRICVRCKGTGMYSKRKPKSHKPDCTCVFCGPCPVCEGARYVVNEEVS